MADAAHKAPSDHRRTRGVVESVHWSLWASDERCPGQGMNIGYPTRSPFHTEGRRGSVDPDESPRAAITSVDRRIASLLALAVERVLSDHSERSLLRTFYGAYPGATADPGERMAQCCRITGKAESATRHHIRHVREWVEGWVDAALRLQAD